MFHDLKLSIERAIRKIRVRRCDVPFVILFRERSGSTHLCSLLESHPDVHCRREDFILRQCRSGEQPPKKIIRINDMDMIRLLNTYAGQVECESRKQAVRHLHDIYSSPGKACGFKIKQENKFQCYPEIFDELIAMGSELRVIVLRRRNLLRKAISQINLRRIQHHYGYANLSQDIVDDQGHLLPKSFTVDIAQMVQRMRWLIAEEADFEEAIKVLLKPSVRRLEIDYSALLNAESETIRSVLEFLEVDSDLTLHSELIKATPTNLTEIVENYHQLEGCLRRNGWAEFLGDE